MRSFSFTLLLVFFVEAAVSESWITRAGKFEGDIALTAEQERQLIFNSTERNAIINPNSRWIDGRVPYQFNNQFDANEQNVIRGAFEEYSAKTCIEFVERNGEPDYIEFIKDGGCYSYVGRTGGRQAVSLGDGCVQEYVVIHELMHAVGFFHEQSRYDRDQYVRVNWPFICCDAAGNFQAETQRTVQHLDEPYDLKSIMHYGEYDFSVNEHFFKTIEAIDGTSPLGNTQGFTQIDLNKLNKLYECSTAESEETESEETAESEETTGSNETTEVICEDLFNYCQLISLIGFCGGHNTEIMRNLCPASCNYC